MGNKRGITFIVLTITIILTLVLVATTVATAGNAMDNSRITVFANDLKEVANSTKIYFMQKGAFPVLGDDKAYSKSDIMKDLPTKSKQILDQELTLNKDNVNNENLGTFYKLDLGKLDVEKTSRGTMENDDVNDVYIVAYPSMNVYYLNGIAAKNSMYFSLSSRISNIVNIESNDNVIGDSELVSVAGIVAKKEKKTWTNKVNTILEVNINSGEDLFMMLDGGSEHRISSKAGQNVYFIGEDFSDVTYSLDNHIIDIGMSQNELTAFNNKTQQEKKVYFYKKIGSSKKGEIVVDYSNYEVKIPTKTVGTKINSTDVSNILTLEVEDITSGIKDIKYEYLTKYDDKGIMQDYYDLVTSYENSYLITRGKSAKKISDTKFEIELPKDISSVQLIILDNAGNASQKINEVVNLPVYIGINELNPTKTNVTLNNIIKTLQNITSSYIQISTDGINYTSMQSLTLKNEGGGIYSSVVNCENLVGVKDSLFVRITVNYADSKNEVCVKEIKVYN